MPPECLRKRKILKDRVERIRLGKEGMSGTAASIHSNLKPLFSANGTKIRPLLWKRKSFGRPKGHQQDEVGHHPSPHVVPRRVLRPQLQRTGDVIAHEESHEEVDRPESGGEDRHGVPGWIVWSLLGCSGTSITMTLDLATSQTLLGVVPASQYSCKGNEQHDTTLDT